MGFNDDGQPINELGNGWGCYDLGLHNMLFLLKAKEMGLDTLVMGIRDAQKLREVLEEPKKPRRRELDDIAKFY